LDKIASAKSTPKSLPPKARDKRDQTAGEMSRQRIVLDTNVVISAALKPFGPQALVLSRSPFARSSFCVSEEIMAEYRECSAGRNSLQFLAPSERLLP